MKEVYDKFGLETGTRDFIGHAMALYLDDSYLDAPGKAPEALDRIRLYGNSVSRYGKSPYIYPLYGLGELPQGFARLSAIYGGTYMLNASVDEVLYDGGAVSGIKATMKNGNEPEMKFETKAKFILADPSYFASKAKVVGHVLRAICVLKHPIAGTNDADSAQIIIPQSQVGRKNDIYIACISSAHNVCPKGYYIAIVSTIAETSANHHLELQPGLERLGKIEEQFLVSLIYPPLPRARSVLTCCRVPPSRCTSLSRTAPRTRSSSPRATTPPLTSRLLPTTSRTSTVGALARSSRLMSCARASRWPRSKSVVFCVDPV